MNILMELCDLDTFKRKPNSGILGQLYAPSRSVQQENGEAWTVPTWHPLDRALKERLESYKYVWGRVGKG